MLVLTLLAAVAIAAFLVMLTLAAVKKWFRQNNGIRNKIQVNVVLKQKLASGNYKTVAGVFDTAAERIVTANAWESEKLDEDLKKLDRVAVIRNLD